MHRHTAKAARAQCTISYCSGETTSGNSCGAGTRFHLDPPLGSLPAAWIRGFLLSGDGPSAAATPALPGLRLCSALCPSTGRTNGGRQNRQGELEKGEKLEVRSWRTRRRAGKEKTGRKATADPSPPFAEVATGFGMTAAGEGWGARVTVGARHAVPLQRKTGVVAVRRRHAPRRARCSRPE